MKNLFFITFSLLITITAVASQVYDRGLDKSQIWVEGYLQDEPRSFSGNSGQSQSVSFTVMAAAQRKHGDEFIMVTCYTKKWGVNVGTCGPYHKGDKVRIQGKYNETRQRAGHSKTGIVGSLYVNDKSYKEVKGR